MDKNPQRSRTIPLTVFFVAVLAAILHLVPFWWAQALTPQGSQFTGNVSVQNPDVMQYRIWYRQTAQDGPLVSNVFTAEPNRPHMLLIFSWSISQAARLLSVEPEVVYEYAGSAFAFALVIVVFVLIREFIADAHQQWWVFFATMIGGGLGAYLNAITRLDALKSNQFVQFALGPLEEWPVFENRRGVYLFANLFDTHYLFIWTLTAVCMLALYRALQKFSPARLLMAAFLYGALTLLHLHEGPTLLLVTTATAVLCWIKKVMVWPAVATMLVTNVVVLACLAWQGSLVTASGLPFDHPHGPLVPPTLLFLAFPLAWILAVPGVSILWKQGKATGLFLIAWMVGCTLLTLGGPFNPYPQRGITSLQIPLTILAGIGYFGTRRRVRWGAALIAVFVLGATPAWFLTHDLAYGARRWRPTAYASYLDQPHQELIDRLRASAGPDDVLLAEQRSLLWLAPYYPGKHYYAHYFLTVNFQAKKDEFLSFLAATPDLQADFIKRSGARFMFIEADQKPERFQEIAGLRVIKAIPEGTLFEYKPL